MKYSGPITKVSLLLGTIICLGAFFLVDNNIPVQALHKEEQILDDYDDLAEFANAVRNGDEDLEEIPIESMEAADIYDDADDSTKDCIDLAGKVGDSLSDREVIHCVDDVNYFKNKYSSNSTVATNATLDTSAIPTVTETETETDATSTSETSTSDDATSTSETSTSDDATSTSETSTSDDATSTSETSTSDNVTENNLINELVNTGKFTEDEAKEFVSKNMLSGTDATTTSGDTQTTSDADTSTDDTQTTSDADTSTDDTQTTSDADTSTDDTQTTSDADTSTDDTSSTDNEGNDDDSSSSNANNPEEYDSLSELVDDIKNSDIDTDEISLNDFQNSGAYQGADEETQDCIDLAGKIGGNLIDYEIVRCTEDPNHFKNQIANNDDNSDVNNDNSDVNNDNNNNDADDDTGN